MADEIIVCDAMLGKLARWLRAAGYDAAFAYGIDDGDLVRQAQASGAVILTSDGGIFERNLIRSGEVRAVFVPRELTTAQQLGYVLAQLHLPVQPMPRCMTCGGELHEVPHDSVKEEAPARAFANVEQFWRCGRCGKLLWQGTHWTRIRGVLEGL